jgi:hypothetical protein
MTDLTLTSGVVIAVVNNIVAHDSAGGSPAIASETRSGGANYAGANQNTTSSPATYQEVMMNDPATSAAWSIASVNAAELGMKVV